jgi:cytochrome b561
MSAPPTSTEGSVWERQRFTPLQRLLHWLMALCILAMLFIGVAMVSTVKPKHLTLVSIHKPLGIAILVLALVRLAVRPRYRSRRCWPTCPNR